MSIIRHVSTNHCNLAKTHPTDFRFSPFDSPFFQLFKFVMKLDPLWGLKMYAVLSSIIGHRHELLDGCIRISAVPIVR